MEKEHCNTEGSTKMDVKMLKKTATELEIEVEGVGHTVCNLIQKRLLEDESVDLGGYDVPHPLASSSVIYLRTKGKAKPEEVLLRAVEKARLVNKEFGKELQKVLKKT
jgi:DNA-directed RNA polymerase subunit L